MKKYDEVWRTEAGELIEYEKLEDRHLLNILKFIEKRAKEGMTLIYGGGFDAEDMWYNEEEIKGKEVFEHYDYKGLKKEAKRRKLI
jgi:hypothetical protein